jgi:hypothetical protein
MTPTTNGRQPLRFRDFFGRNFWFAIVISVVAFVLGFAILGRK